jgi:hypothetical protein
MPFRSLHGNRNLNSGGSSNVTQEKPDIFSIYEILDEIIAFAGSCSQCEQTDDLDLYKIISVCSEVHKRNLRTCILVSKAWMNVAVPHLWNRYATLDEIVALIYGSNSKANLYRILIPSRTGLNSVCEILVKGASLKTLSHFIVIYKIQTKSTKTMELLCKSYQVFTSYFRVGFLLPGQFHHSH